MGHDGAYISTKIFSEYATKGSLIAKLITNHIINLLLGEDKTIETNLPAQGVVTLMDQTAEHRLVNHLLYASPVKRGNGIEVIEDIIPLSDITVKLRTDKTPKRVYLAPEKRDIPFTYENGVLAYTVDKLNCHAMAVIDY